MKQLTLEKFSEALCSGTPAPGGGSVSALVGALAASLSGMVANLTLGNGKYPGVQAQMADIASRADQLRKELLEDVQRDSAAFDGCMAAYGMPRQTDAEKAARREAIQRALEGAAAVPLCVAQKGLEILTLAKQGIQIGAHILSIKNEYDENFDMRLSTKTLEYLRRQHYPVINQEKYEKFVNIVDAARMDQDSVGGKVECAIIGLKPGLGEPFFDSIESHLSSLLFSIPAVKSVAFGNDKISELFGSEANDCYYYQDALVKTTSNNNGGITGGISNGMPVVFTVGIKPTPSISKEQKTIDVKKHENTTLGVHGRHDPCIVFRATVVVEAMAALAMLDLVR